MSACWTVRDAGVELIQSSRVERCPASLWRVTSSPGEIISLRRFLEMAHSRGLKVLLYASTGFFEMRDPDFRQGGPAPKRVSGSVVPICTLLACQSLLAGGHITAPAWPDG